MSFLRSKQERGEVVERWLKEIRLMLESGKCIVEEKNPGGPHRAIIVREL